MDTKTMKTIANSVLTLFILITCILAACAIGTPGQRDIFIPCCIISAVMGVIFYLIFYIQYITNKKLDHILRNKMFH